MPVPEQQCQFCGTVGLVQDVSDHMYARYYLHLAARGWQGTFDQLQAEHERVEAEAKQRAAQLVQGLDAPAQTSGAHVAPSRAKRQPSRWLLVATALVVVMFVFGHGNPVEGFHRIASEAKTTAKWVIGIGAVFIVLAIMGAISNLFDSDSRSAGRKLTFREKEDLRRHRKIQKDEMRRRGLH